MNVYQNPTQKVKEIPTCKRAAFRGYRAIADLNLRGNKRKSVFSPVFFGANNSVIDCFLALGATFVGSRLADGERVGNSHFPLFCDILEGVVTLMKASTEGG